MTPSKLLVFIPQGAILLGLAGLSLVSQTGFFNSDALIAIRGFSAIEFVAANQNPGGFEQDFPGGSRVTTSSSPLTWLHLFAHQIGIDSLLFYYVMVGLEIITLLLGASVFWKALVARSPLSKRESSPLLRWSFVAWAPFLLLSNGQRMDLSNFGFPFFHGQFYGFADGLRLAAIGMALRKRWWESALLLSAAFVIHPIKGFFGAIVVLIIFLFSTTRQTTLAGLAKLAMFPLIAGFWSLVTLSRPSTKIELSDFVAWTRVFQSHWYPLDLGVFTGGQFRFFAPFTVVLILMLVGTVMVMGDQHLKRSLIGSIAALTVLTFLGIALSIWPPSEFLIKLSLVRASELIVLLGIPLLLLYWIHFFQSRQFLWASIYALPLILFFLPFNFFIFLSLLGLAVPLLLLLREKRGVAAVLITALWGLFAVLHSATLTITGEWPQAALGLVGALLAFAFLSMFFVLLARGSEAVIATTVLATVIAGAGLWSTAKLNQDFSHVDEGREYLEVQKWASRSTSPTALFMVDPCINYGWRDFSGRASIGTPREWFMTGWGYSGDGSVYELGREISETLGLDLNPIALGPQSGSEVCDISRIAYYAEDLEGLTAMSERFKVDYFVLYRDELKERTGFLAEPWVVYFQNDTFLVVQHRGQK